MKIPQRMIGEFRHWVVLFMRFALVAMLCGHWSPVAVHIHVQRMARMSEEHNAKFWNCCSFLGHVVRGDAAEEVEQTLPKTRDSQHETT